MEPFGKALNKPTGTKCDRSPHSLKNSSVGSLETGAGRVSSPDRVSTKTPHKVDGSKSGLTS